MRIVDPRDRRGRRILSEGDLERFKHNAFENIKPLAPYLHEVWYQSLDYDYAYDRLLNNFPGFAGHCSSMRDGMFYGRNFDWLLNESAEFIVHTPSKCGRYGTIGTATCINGLTEESVKSGGYHENYRILPFLIEDGMNECGLVMNANVVPSGDKGVNMEILPMGDEYERVNAFMLTRFVLDRFDSVEKASSYIREHVTIYFPEKFLVGYGYELHYMMADSS